MNCDDLLKMISSPTVCENTEHGARFMTQCLYPSFDQVAVYVSRWGDGYRVTDGGGAVSCIMRHGRDVANLANAFKKARQRFGVATLDGMVIAEADADWLPAAVMAVANASAYAAAAGVKMANAATEKALGDLILEDLKASVPLNAIASDYEFTGASGKVWHLDYAVTGARPILIKAVSPHPNSVNANHTVFGDVGEGPVRFSVFDRPLNHDDAALMRQVAQLVPLKSVGAGALRELGRPLAHH